jgi:arylsulfatase A-like enzyme
MNQHAMLGIASFASVNLLLSLNAACQTNNAPAEPVRTHQAAARPQWPKSVGPPPDAPNVVVILVDDAGFSATSTFGGQADTSNFTRLAARGLRYNAFAVNSICSPTRAALLSGRNCHQLGYGEVTGRATPYPGYDSIWPKSAASIAEILKENGYSTAAFGKWHNTPVWESGPTGPFDHWPTSLGFQHFYGFVNGWDNQYYPRLFRDTVPIEPPTTPADGYNFTDDITDQAIHWLHEIDAVDSTKPFFLYFATGATHWPLQVPKKWIDKYKDKFDEGWDVLRQRTFERQKAMGVIPANAELTPRPEGLPAWDSLSPEEKKLMAREGEVYSAYAEQADFDIGRLLDAIDEEGKTRNTLVIEIFGDNGGSAEGGLFGTDALKINGQDRTIAERLEDDDELGTESYINFYADAWAWEQSTPFQGTKTDASHLGGTRDPLVISWPARIHDGGGLRTQFQHVTDIAPTIYEAAGVKFPKVVDGVSQLPLEGSSMIYTFDHPNEPTDHHIQYFEALGNRGIYKDGWWAGSLYKASWESKPKGRDANPANRPWELYNLNADYSQAHDLAKEDPAKLNEMIQLFDQEAKRNQVFPLLPPSVPLPSPATGRSVFVYRDGVDRLTEGTIPAIVGRAHEITADVTVGPSDARGVIVTQGGRYGGFALFVKDGHVVYEINSFGNRAGQLVSRDKLKPGASQIVVTVEPDAQPSTPNLRPGKVTLQINGVPEGEAEFSTLIGKQHGETLDIGKDLGTAVSTDYQVPDPFNGKIAQVKVELK